METGAAVFGTESEAETETESGAETETESGAETDAGRYGLPRVGNLRVALLISVALNCG